MPNYLYSFTRSAGSVKVEINVAGQLAVATMFNLEGNISKLESFSTPAAVRGGGGLSYALVKLLLEQCTNKVVKVEGVHGYLHYSLQNLKFANGSWRQDPTYKGEKKGLVVDESSYPKQTRDYVTYTPDTSLWLASLKLIEKGITLTPG